MNRLKKLQAEATNQPTQEPEVEKKKDRKEKKDTKDQPK
jgi:hypothetical protein